MSTSMALVMPTCAICRDEEGGTDMVVTKCGHAFHSECMKQWENTRTQTGAGRKCPYCSTSFQYDYDYNYGSSTRNKYTRLHSLTLRRVYFVPEGEPSPEEEIKLIRGNLDSAKVLLNKETHKVRQLETEKSDLVRAKEALEAAVTHLKSEAKVNSNKLSNALAELKSEKQNQSRQKNSNLVGEKERLQTKVDNASAYIDKLKAERQETQNNLFALRVDNTNVRANVSKQAATIKELQSQYSQLVRDKDKLQARVNALEREAKLAPIRQCNQSSDSANVLNDLSVGFQKMEDGYLTFKNMYARKLEETKNAKMNLNASSVHEIPINPSLLQPINSLNNQQNNYLLANEINPMFADPMNNMLFNQTQHVSTKYETNQMLTNQMNHMLANQINQVIDNSINLAGLNPTNPGHVKQHESGAGKSKPAKNKGKQRAAMDYTKEKAPNNKRNKKHVVASASATKKEDPSNSNTKQQGKESVPMDHAVENGPSIKLDENHVAADHPVAANNPVAADNPGASIKLDEIHVANNNPSTSIKLDEIHVASNHSMKKEDSTTQASSQQLQAEPSLAILAGPSSYSAPNLESEIEAMSNLTLAPKA